MKTTTYPSVWDAITDTPQETASMKARSKLMMALSDTISQRQLRQKDAAELFGVTQPRISDLLRGKINRLVFCIEKVPFSSKVRRPRPRCQRTSNRNSRFDPRDGQEYR